jgi:tRNA(adenine34) deaminase
MSTGYEALFEPAMRLALSAAAEAVASADPGDADVPVGAVVLDAAGAVIARARNRREADQDPTAHAEILAIREAARVTGHWRLTGCTLVVTLEPCTMCAGAVTHARLDRLVYGADDPKAGAVGTLWDVVRDPRLAHRPEVLRGVLAGECAALLRAFFAARRHRGPADQGRREADPAPSGPGADESDG